MTTPRWEAGKLYPPGSLVQPVSSAASTVTTIPNPGFESGATGWSFSGGGAYSASGGFSGPGCARITGSNGAVVLTSGIAVTPGQSITASCMGSMPAGSAGTSFDCKLVWYDSSDVLISTTEGTELRRSEGSGWRKSTTTGVAPPGAAFVRIGADGNVAVGGDIYIDDFSWNYLPSSTPGGLIYKAVQAEVGASGSSEPAWPTVLGNTVVDNEVTWEAVQANQVVWVATPLMKSGSTEPSWPTEVGSSVIDNTIRWEAISRRVTDENCPNTEAVVIMASKVFAGDEDIVRFSATANPLDWTSEQDAGYLPTGLQQANANSVAVLAPYRANLAVFNAACFQAWQADPDPAVMAILDQMDGIGSTWPRAAVAVGDELFFLSALGVRTVSISGGNESLTAGDVGMPVDPLVQEGIAVVEDFGGDPLGAYYPSLGQFMLTFPERDDLSISGDAPDGEVAVAYSFSYTVEGGFPPYTVSLLSGSLPSGISLSSAGVLSGTPTTAGTTAWVVRVTDSQGNTADHSDGAVISIASANYLALLHFDGNNNDETGKSWSGGVPATSPVKFGSGSVRINGHSSNVSTSAKFETQIGTGPFSIDCWIYRDSNAPGHSQDIILGHWYASGTRSLNWTISRSTNIASLFLSGDGTAFTQIDSSLTIPYDEWVHMRVTRDGTDTVRQFVNGVMSGSATFSGALHENVGLGTNWIIGGNDSTANLDPTQGFEGWVDEFAIFNVCLSTADFTPPTAPWSNP